MIKTKSTKTLQRTRSKIKAFIIAFAAVITAAYAPQTGPFQRFVAPEPTIPNEDPVTDAELAEICPPRDPTPDPGDDVAKRRGRDRESPPLFKRFRSRTERGLRRSRSDVTRNPKMRFFQRWGPRRHNRRAVDPN